MTSIGRAAQGVGGMDTINPKRAPFLPQTIPCLDAERAALALATGHRVEDTGGLLAIVFIQHDHPAAVPNRCIYRYAIPHKGHEGRGLYE